MEIKTTDTYTEIYVTGGGNWITESYPTNFHNFYKRKMLLPDEDVNDYKEITSTQKTDLENADAKWERPPQSFIDQWNEAAGDYGGYNEDTGYFELNGLTDIAYKEALEIYRLTSSVHLVDYDVPQRHKLRTAFPFYAGRAVDLTGFLLYCQIDIVRFIQYYGDGIHVTNMRQAFEGAKRVLTPLVVSYFNTTSSTQGFYLAFGNKIEYILLKGLNRDLPFGKCPNLELYCFQYVIEHAANTAAITITVHPDVFAKLAGDTSNDAAAALSEEELAQWMALVEQAANKNIQFATT